MNMGKESGTSRCHTCLMEQLVGVSRRAATDVKRQDELALGGHCCPDPNAFSILFHFGHQFIKLQMANGQSPVEQSLVEPFAVMATAFNPAGDGRVMMAKDATGG